MAVPIDRQIEVIEAVLNGARPEQLRQAGGYGVHTVYRWLRKAGVKLLNGFAQTITDTAVNHRPPIPPAPTSGHGRRLTPVDRALIQVGLAEGFSQRKIAAMIAASPSTVSREIRRHQHHVNSSSAYSANIAQHRAEWNRARPKPRKLDTNPALRAEVIAGLNAGWSPQQIQLRLPLLFPDDEHMRISPESVYQSLYVQTKGALRHELVVEQALRSGRTTRKPRSKLPARTTRTWVEGYRLADRSLDSPGFGREFFSWFSRRQAPLVGAVRGLRSG